jgi:hypothetical protein
MKKNYKLFTAGLIVAAINSASAQCPIPSLVTASPSTICAGSTTSLNATALGTSINWFTVPVGGVAVGSSASATNFTISPATTTTYYAESYTSAVPTTTYAFTGAVQSYTVPVGVSSLTVEAYGAQGQTAGSSIGGLGAYTKATLTVTSGQVISIYVGGQNGYNGGGLSGTMASYTAGVGGGASDIRVGGVALTNRVLVAGGGGGAGKNACTSQSGGAGGYPGGLGGLGDGTNGANGGVNGGDVSGGGGACISCCSSSRGGGGGGQNGGGGQGGYGTSTGGTLGSCGTNNSDYSSGCGSPVGIGYGCFGIGGDGLVPSCNGGGGGGGGGWYGGGGGGANWSSGGGGGSSYYGTLAAPTTSNGVRSGNGQVVISGSPATCTSVSRTSVTVTVGSIPTISVTSGAICAGSSYTMVASGANTYTYTGGSAVVTPTANTSYSVTGTSTLGCAASNTAVSSVTVNAVSPSVTASTSNSIICSGESVVLTASTSATSYTWNTGATTMSVSVSPIVTSTYTVNVSNGTACIATSTIMVTVNACTGINEVYANSISVYPNPTSGMVNVILTSELLKNSTLEVYDALGKLVVKQVLINELNTINISNLNNGIYTFKVLNNSNIVKIGKIVKQ